MLPSRIEIPAEKASLLRTVLVPLGGDASTLMSLQLSLPKGGLPAPLSNATLGGGEGLRPDPNAALEPRCVAQARLFVEALIGTPIVPHCHALKKED